MRSRRPALFSLPRLALAAVVCTTVAVLAPSPAMASGTERSTKTTAAAKTASASDITVAAQRLGKPRARRATRAVARQVYNDTNWTTYYGAGYCVRISRTRVDCLAWVGNPGRECSWYVANKLRPNGTLRSRFAGDFSCY